MASLFIWPLQAVIEIRFFCVVVVVETGCPLGDEQYFLKCCWIKYLVSHIGIYNNA